MARDRDYRRRGRPGTSNRAALRCLAAASRRPGPGTKTRSAAAGDVEVELAGGAHDQGAAGRNGDGLAGGIGGARGFAGMDAGENVSSAIGRIGPLAGKITEASEIGWKPLHFLVYVSQSIAAVLQPAGLENAIGIISATFGKDPTDPRWAEDANTKDYLAWLQKYHPGGKPTEIFFYAGYAYAQTLVYLLEQCGDDLSRENIMHQAISLHAVTFPWLLPGITLNTSSTDYQPLKMMRETRFNGKTWELLDDIN